MGDLRDRVVERVRDAHLKKIRTVAAAAATNSAAIQASSTRMAYMHVPANSCAAGDTEHKLGAHRASQEWSHTHKPMNEMRSSAWANTPVTVTQLHQVKQEMEQEKGKVTS